jgi:hypothetical protein
MRHSDGAKRMCSYIRIYINTATVICCTYNMIFITQFLN